MSELHSIVLGAFKSRGWACREVTGRDVVETGFDAYHGRVPVHVQSFGDAGIVSVVANASLPVPASHRERAAELLMRVNKELILGNFEMEWDGGAVMFRIANLCLGDHPDEELIASLVHNAVAEMDRLAPFLGELLRTNAAALPMLDVKALLQREELLPPTGDE